MEITLNDFQAHSKTSLILTGGFAAIVGPSNCGKSSIVRAIRWLIYDSLRGNRFIRLGEDKSVVSLSFDGVEVTRVKGKKQNRYVVNASNYDAIGKGAPIEVTQAISIGTMRVDKDTEIELSVGQQMDPPFLVFEPESMRAKFVNVLTGGHVVDAAVRESNRLIKEINEDSKRVDTDQVRVAQDLTQYVDLDIREAHLNELGALLGRAHVCEQRLKVLSDSRIRLNSIREQRGYANAKAFIVAWVDLSHVAKVDALANRFTSLARVRESLATIQRTRFGLVAQIGIVGFVDEQTITRACQLGEYVKVLTNVKSRLLYLTNERARYSATVQALIGIDANAEQTVRQLAERLNGLLGLRDRLMGIRSQRIGATYALNAMAGITPNLADHVKVLTDRFEMLTRAKGNFLRISSQRLDLVKKVADADLQMVTIQRDLDVLSDSVCEACGQMVTKEVRQKQLTGVL